MKRRTVLIVAAGLAAGALCVGVLPDTALFVRPESSPADDLAASGGRWACPMMDFIGNKPGRCPVCGMQMQPVTAGEITTEQRRRMGVETTRVTEGPAVITVRAYGAAEYDHRYTQVVIPRVAGRITHRHEATYGCCQEIAAGARVLDLYSDEVIAAQGELQAAVKLGEERLIGALRQRFERWNLSDVAANIEKGGAIRDTVTIHSPFAGQVLLDDMESFNEALEVGREVMPDTPLLRLVDPDRLTLVVHVPETQGRFLQEGQAVELESDDRGPLPGVTGIVDRLAQEINPEIRTREVRIYLSGARNVLVPGSLVSARIRGALGADLQPAEADDSASWGRFALVPKTAVLSTGVRHVAWRVAGRDAAGNVRFEIAPLALGPRIEDESGNDLYVVRAGLQAGDEVATQGAFLIDSQAQLAGTPSLLYPQGATGPAAAPAAHAH